MSSTKTESGLVLPPESAVRPARDLREAFAQIVMENFSSFEMPRGTNTQGDVLTQLEDGTDLNDLWATFQRSLELWNRERSRLVSALTFAVNRPSESVPQMTGEDFEEASEFGEPKGIRTQMERFALGYDFKWYDLAIRYTWQFLAEATRQEVEVLNNLAMEADNRLIFNKVLRAIFNNVNREATIKGEAFNVYPFYNGDGTVPPTWKNSAHTGTHTHYLTSGAAVVDSGDLDAIEEHLTHHGYGRQNGSTMILLVNRQELNTIRTFRVATGATYDFISAQNQPPWIIDEQANASIRGAIPGGSVNGLQVAGQYGPLLIIEEDYIPPAYMLAFATGGINQATNPVGFRQHANAGLRGLRLVKGRDNDYPLTDSFYQRGFGTGVRHRGAGLVMQVTVNAAYAIPGAYA